MTEIQVCPKAIIDEVTDAHGATRSLYLFGIPQPDGSIKQLLVLEGMMSCVLLTTCDLMYLISSGCDVFTAHAVMRAVSRWSELEFPQPQRLQNNTAS